MPTTLAQLKPLLPMNYSHDDVDDVSPLAHRTYHIAKHYRDRNNLEKRVSVASFVAAERLKQLALEPVEPGVLQSVALGVQRCLPRWTPKFVTGPNPLNTFRKRAYTAIIILDQHKLDVESTLVINCLYQFDKIINWPELEVRNKEIASEAQLAEIADAALDLEVRVENVTNSAREEMKRQAAFVIQRRKNNNEVEIVFRIGNDGSSIIVEEEQMQDLRSSDTDFDQPDGHPTFTVDDSSSGKNGYKLLFSILKLADVSKALDDLYCYKPPGNANLGKTFPAPMILAGRLQHIKNIRQAPPDKIGDAVELALILVPLPVAREHIRKLHGIDAQHVMNVLYDASQLESTAANFILQSETVRILQDLSEVSGGMLPHALRREGVDIPEKDRRKPFALGTFADVFRGTLDGKEVSVKVPKIQAEDDVKTRVRFCREALLWQTLMHKNILPFSGTSITLFPENVLCLLSPFMKNKTILKHIKTCSSNGEPCSNFDIYTYICHIVDGLHYLHSQDVIHGDLKCDNIVMGIDKTTSKLIPHLIDFGISSYAAPGTLPQSRLGSGTPEWTSPEILSPPMSWNGYTKTGHRITKTIIADMRQKSDVYSLAMVIIELFTWQSPWASEDLKYFDGVTRDNIIYKAVISGERPDKNAAAVPQILQPLLKECWQSNYTLRPNMGRVQEKLMALCNADFS